MNIVSPFDIRLADSAGQKRTALDATTTALAYLIREFETYGGLDRTNMAHAYSAVAIGRAVLALDLAQRES